MDQNKMMKYNKETRAFWTGPNAQNHIIAPNSKSEFPEGDGILKLLHALTEDETVIDMGCGVGRLTRAFQPNMYIGMDINENLLREAKHRNPGYNFQYFKPGDNPGNSTWILLYTVLLHIHDDDIVEYLENLTKCCHGVIIGEIMDSTCRKSPKPGKPPVFNRDIYQYVDLMNDIGFTLDTHLNLDYHGVKDRFNLLRFRKLK